MKYLDKYQFITIENNKKYVVVGSVIYEDKNFVYIINSEDVKDQLIAMVTKDDTGINIDIIDEKSDKNAELFDKLSEMFTENLFLDEVEEV